MLCYQHVPSWAKIRYPIKRIVNLSRPMTCRVSATSSSSPLVGQAEKTPRFLLALVRPVYKFLIILSYLRTVLF